MQRARASLERGADRVLRTLRGLLRSGGALRADLAFIGRSLRGDGPSPVLRSGRRASSIAEPPTVAPPVAAPRALAPLPSGSGVTLVPGGPADAVERAVPGTVITVRATGASSKFTVTAPSSILEAALAAGVSMPSSCRAGGCGACKVRLVTGRVVLPAGHCLTDAELDAGEILTCVGCATTDLTLEVP